MLVEESKPQRTIFQDVMIKSSHHQHYETQTSIICAPQLMGTKSPFNKRENDNGEMAAQEEQGGSSMRSNSCCSPRYMGDGVVNVSTELLNSVDADSKIMETGNKKDGTYTRNKSFVNRKKGKLKKKTSYGDNKSNLNDSCLGKGGNTNILRSVESSFESIQDSVMDTSNNRFVKNEQMLVIPKNLFHPSPNQQP